MAGSSDGQDFSGSFTDLMTSLAIVFLILAVAMVIVFVLNSSKAAQVGTSAIQETEKIKAQKNILLDKIKEYFAPDAKGLHFSTNDNCVEIDGKSDFQIVIRFNGSTGECLKSGFFFSTGSFNLDYNLVRENVKRVSKIYEYICSSIEVSNTINNFQIVGHTNDVYFSGDDQNCFNSINAEMDERSKKLFGKMQCGNIYLSAQRARSVFLLVGAWLDSNTNSFDCFTTKTQISGRGPFEPKLDPESLEPIIRESPQHKRVELIFNFKQPNISVGNPTQ